MEDSTNRPKLIYEEKKAITLFLWLFNSVFFIFDIFYYYILPSRKRTIEIHRDGLGIWIYLLMIGLLLVAIYLLKKGKPFIVKYIYITSYLCIDIADNMFRYLGTTKDFAAGNIVEVVIILFSPIFVNKKYFWVVSLGLISKDVLLGIILKNSFAFFPAGMYFILSILAYIILVRFNSYIKTLTSVHEELKQKEKLAIVGRMAAAIGHEIKNPLSSLKGFTQLQQERNPDINEFYPIMIEEIDRINSIVDDLMYLGKPKKVKLDTVNLEDILAYTLSITQQQVKRQGINVEILISRPLPPLESDQKQLKQMFLNLIKNAIEAMPEGGRLIITVKVVEDNKIFISVQDEGCGIADKTIQKLGEPFFTTKKDGTGLGLMVTNQIIKDHNGELNIESELGKGTQVNFTLPIRQNKLRK